MSNSSTKTELSKIMFFFEKHRKKSNDDANKTRENILVYIADLYYTNPKVFFDKEYGYYWMLVYTAWEDAIKLLAKGETFTSFKVVLKAGRGHHYDMDINYYIGKDISFTKMVEFKNGASNLFELPQFIQLTTCSYNLVNADYATFYYKKFLEDYMKCDENITLPKLSLEEYLKDVKKIEPSTPFIKQLKEYRDNNKIEKTKVVHLSIKTFLDKYAKTLHTKILIDKIRTTQLNKEFLMWDGAKNYENDTHHKAKFHHDNITVDDIDKLMFKEVINNNTIVAISGSKTYYLTLRWQNTNGINNPAWQIKIKNLA